MQQSARNTKSLADTHITKYFKTLDNHPNKISMEMARKITNGNLCERKN
jgi:hypothetical protein